MAIESLADIQNHLSNNASHQSKSWLQETNVDSPEFREDHPYLSKLLSPRTGLDTARDFAYGMGKGAANIAQMVNPNAPDMPDIRSKNPSSLATAAGQFLPSMVAGGSSLIGQAISAGLYGSTQAKPEQENLLLPN